MHQLYGRGVCVSLCFVSPVQRHLLVSEPEAPPKWRIGVADVGNEMQVQMSVPKLDGLLNRRRG
jgi:hypothetical protein